MGEWMDVGLDNIGLGRVGVTMKLCSSNVSEKKIFLF